MNTLSLQPGLIALHSNRTEALADTVFAWLRKHPLSPLEEDIVLVQSNGVAEWFKMALASHGGVCAAARVELPGRFLWRTYRQVLGRSEVPAQSPVDKTPLTWRLMQLLPGLLEVPEFAPVARFLRPGGADRLLQLASRLADLFDQYQVYRPDWLVDWFADRDVLAAPGRPDLVVSPDQQWQPLLWRAVMESLDERERRTIRPLIHQRALEELRRGAKPNQPVARRVVLFGASHVPLPVLQMLAALAGHTQVLLAIPNPCRFHWADIMEGRDLLRLERRRQPLRAGRDLVDLPLEDMHAHAHPLLAAWGRQGRDFVRQLDEFDDAEQAQQRFALPRVDLFDEEDTPGAPLLLQVQQHIRDLRPLAEHPKLTADALDRSIVFHQAHSALREVEVLHDQLLALLANRSADNRLQPRDVVVMVPNIDTMAPAIRAVFGQYGRHDKRFIPFDIADLSARASSPLVSALEWLLRLPQQRCRLSELRDLLDVPAVAARFGVAPDALGRLTQWMAGAGIRWGLNETQRSGLGLSACGAQNTSAFGLRRMLLGYASGTTPFADLQPYGEVGGLEAELAGALASLLHRLELWRVQASVPATPAQWAERGRALLADLVAPTDDADRDTLAALDDALTRWQEACAQAQFDEAVPLAVARKAWLDTLEEPALSQRFRAGGVTFCTLMPMRAIPFEVVCLLGMNDGDYPRRAPRSDFDLMGLPGQHRPGDRSRQSDDRQLMLEALLSARRVLYVSWTGHSVRDNSAQPPSVLVSQLRDYLAAGWSGEVLAPRTTEHPLQPFSRRYFEGTPGLQTYAREWRSAHAVSASVDVAVVATTTAAAPLTAWTPDVSVPLTVDQLARFLRNPVKTFFRERLGVAFDAREEDPADDESFGLGGLEEYGVVQTLVDEVLTDMAQLHSVDADTLSAELAALLSTRLHNLRRAGRLPLGGFAERTQAQLEAILLPLLQAWQRVQAQHPTAMARVPLHYKEGAATPENLNPLLQDWLDHLREGTQGPDDAPVWLELTPSKLLQDAKKGTLRTDKLLTAWVRSLAAAASDVVVHGILVGRDATLRITPLDADSAQATLDEVLRAWREGMAGPLPLALRTGLALVTGKEAAAVVAAAAYDGGYQRDGDVAEPCLGRMYPDFDALTDDGRFERLAHTLCGPLAEWANTHVHATPHGLSSLDRASVEGTTV
ncbi:exodeoxyribonuclease V subunit gamma [Simplicispira psychrophila]|uniref:exodeoxyribonuclease V subunit gamma n=1 Tax=Simplicispira psychrophila TaxID=80882 RepID=UPI00068AB5A8|nr:exodeoxyribonuclease V subunit gamma [Simplicispira psychrophila]